MTQCESPFLLALVGGIPGVILPLAVFLYLAAAGLRGSRWASIVGALLAVVGIVFVYRMERGDPRSAWVAVGSAIHAATTMGAAFVREPWARRAPLVTAFLAPLTVALLIGYGIYVTETSPLHRSFCG